MSRTLDEADRRLGDAVEGAFTRPFHAGGAERVAVFYTPHRKGWCRRSYCGGATYQNRNLYPDPPQKRVHRDTDAEVWS